jgi:hypothetical protein
MIRERLEWTESALRRDEPTVAQDDNLRARSTYLHISWQSSRLHALKSKRSRLMIECAGERWERRSKGPGSTVRCPWTSSQEVGAVEQFRHSRGAVANGAVLWDHSTHCNCPHGSASGPSETAIGGPACRQPFLPIVRVTPFALAFRFMTHMRTLLGSPCSPASRYAAYAQLLGICKLEHASIQLSLEWMVSGWQGGRAQLGEPCDACASQRRLICTVWQPLRIRSFTSAPPQ